MRLYPALNRLSGNELGSGQTRAGPPCHSTCREQIYQEGLCVPFRQLRGPLQQGKAVIPGPGAASDLPGLPRLLSSSALEKLP